MKKEISEYRSKTPKKYKIQRMAQMARLSIAIVGFGKLHRCILAIGGRSRANDVDACGTLARLGTIITQRASKLRVFTACPAQPSLFLTVDFLRNVMFCDVRSVVFTPSATWEIKASA